MAASLLLDCYITRCIIIATTERWRCAEAADASPRRHAAHTSFYDAIAIFTRSAALITSDATSIIYILLLSIYRVY